MRLRPVTPGDLPVLYAIHREALGPYVDATWGWDESFQAREFERRSADPDRRVIEVDGEIAGFLSVAEDRGRIVVRTIELASRFQRRGIGTVLIEDILARARESGLPVDLRVLKCNPARRLYERLGFQPAGESETHVYLCVPAGD